MRVKITEERLSDAGYVLSKDDTITVDDKLGGYWCDQGWAEDVDGKHPTGERRVIGAELAVEKASHSTKSTNPGKSTSSRKGAKNG